MGVPKILPRDEQANYSVGFLIERLRLEGINWLKKKDIKNWNGKKDWISGNFLQLIMDTQDQSYNFWSESLTECAHF